MRTTNLCRAYVIIALVLPAVAHAGDTTLAALLSDPAGFDGQQVQIQGTLTDLRAQRTRKGDLYHTFTLSEDERTIAILASKPPSCAAGSRVTVHGTVRRLQPGLGKSGAVMIDAAAVTCLGTKKSSELTEMAAG